MRAAFRLAAGAAIGLVLASGAALAENIRIAFIDPLSGPFEATGANGLAEWEYAAGELVNKPGLAGAGNTFEIVAFDNRNSPRVSLTQLRAAIDEGIRFIAQGNSSGVAAALTDAIGEHNRGNPEDRVLFLNYSAIDPALTNDRCSFWHFRFDANAGIRMDALTDVIAKDDAIRKVYLIGPDYWLGAAAAAAAVRFLGEKRPDIEIAGNELHPVLTIDDFTPQARKIAASGADAVIAASWGEDMAGIGKSVIEQGFTGPVYTYYGAANGITKAFGAQGKGVIRLVAEGPLNPPASDRMKAYAEGFKAKNPNLDITQPRIANAAEMLAKAIAAAGSTDAAAVATALEGMEHDSIWGGKVHMRPQDHQAIQNVHIMVHTDENITFDLDNSGFGLLTESSVEMAGRDSPTTCGMTRP